MGTMFGVLANQSLQVFVSSYFKLIIIAEIAVVVVISFGIRKINAAMAGLLFMGYSLLTGLTLSFVFFVYDPVAIILAFSTTIVIFVVMTIFGYYTKENLMGYGRMLMVALVSLIIMSVINIFLNSPSLYWIISYAGVIIFTALIGYDMQKIKNNLIVNSQGDSEVLSKIAIIGALELYLDFVNLFLYLLRILGKKR